jgi:circadian clock protein KaiC
MGATEAVPTGIAGLDDILSGGLPSGRMYLLQGEPGAGKTTLAMQFLLAGVAAGETCLYIALSETRAELEDVAESHGWNLANLQIHELDASDTLPEEMNTLFDPAEVELRETADALLRSVERLSPTRVVFDSLSELRMLARDPLRFRRQVLALKEYFAGRECTVLLLDDEQAQSGDMQLRTVAHGVITLQHQSPEYGVDRRHLRVAKLRGRAYRGGYHDYVIARGGLVVFPRLIAAEHQGPITNGAASSGCKELDALVGGGFDRGTSTLLLGPSGTGKSAITAACVQAAAERGERSLVLLFEENRRTYLARSRSMGFGMDEHVEAGLVHVRQVDPAEMSPGELSALVRHEVESQGTRIVVLDSLNGYLVAMPGERYLVIQLHELLMYLAQLGVTSFLVVAQAGLIGTMAAPVDVTYLADAVVLTRFFEAEGVMRKAVSMLKKRSGPHEHSIRELRLGTDGLSLGEPLTALQGVMTGVPRRVGAPESWVNDAE